MTANIIDADLIALCVLIVLYINNGRDVGIVYNKWILSPAANRNLPICWREFRHLRPRRMSSPSFNRGSRCGENARLSGSVFRWSSLSASLSSHSRSWLLSLSGLCGTPPSREMHLKNKDREWRGVSNFPTGSVANLSLLLQRKRRSNTSSLSFVYSDSCFFCAALTLNSCNHRSCQYQNYFNKRILVKSTRGVKTALPNKLTQISKLSKRMLANLCYLSRSKVLRNMSIFLEGFGCTLKKGLIWRRI